MRVALADAESNASARLRFRRTTGHGRRLGATSTLEAGVLSGRLQTLGYFAAQLCLGTPPRRFELVVDTGSAITSVPCQSCNVCGLHRCGISGRFDERASSTAERAVCGSSAALECESCADRRCTYRVAYLEGSLTSGQVLRDMASFEVVPENATTTHAVHTQLVRARTFFGKLRQARHTSSPTLPPRSPSAALDPWPCAPPARLGCVSTA